LKPTGRPLAARGGREAEKKKRMWFFAFFFSGLLRAFSLSLSLTSFL